MHHRWLIALALCLLPLPFASAALPKHAGHLPAHQAHPKLLRHTLTRTERRYLVQLQGNSNYFSDALSEFQLLMARPKLGNTVWTHKMAVVLSAMHLLAARGRALQAPSRYRSAQQTYRRAMAEYDKVCQTMPGAVDHRNKAAMARCMGYLAMASHYSHRTAQQVAAASRSGLGG